MPINHSPRRRRCLKLSPVRSFERTSSGSRRYSIRPLRDLSLAAHVKRQAPVVAMMFTLGRAYSRSEIHAQLGGSTVACLPTKDGRIVAACLSKDFSPQAPEVVLCGQGARTGPVSAVFSRHCGPLPVFIKLAANRWEYRGRFVVAESLSSGTRFNHFIAGSGRSIASVSCIVLLRQDE